MNTRFSSALALLSPVVLLAVVCAPGCDGGGPRKADAPPIKAKAEAKVPSDGMDHLKRFYAAHMTRRGEFTYYAAAGEKGGIQFKDLTLLVDVLPPTEADKLNGIEWKATVYGEPVALRTFTCADGAIKWTAWRDYNTQDPGIDAFLNFAIGCELKKVNGQWHVNSLPNPIAAGLALLTGGEPPSTPPPPAHKLDDEAIKGITGSWTCAEWESWKAAHPVATAQPTPGKP